MKKRRLKSLTVLIFFIIMTGIAMAVHDRAAIKKTSLPLAKPPVTAAGNGIVTVSAELVKDKVLQGSDGIVDMVLTIKTDPVEGHEVPADKAVDMVLVIDRSGSMQGTKINDAKRAALRLLADLTEVDRFGLVSYSEGVWRHSGLIPVDENNRYALNDMVSRIHAGGNTNLGAGLKTGLNILSQRTSRDRPGKMVLISDGLANRGVTQSHELGAMAAVAVAEEFSVSTVGVGAEFNEQLMTAIADRGQGRYYYLQRPDLFAAVFKEEFRQARTVAASGLEVLVSSARGIALVNASGYPVHTRKGAAIFHPGSLGPGQNRKIYLKFRVPTDRQQSYSLGDIRVTYRSEGVKFQVPLTNPMEVACVEDPRVVLNSIDPDGWARQVLENDYNLLKEDVSQDIRTGKKEAALERIDAYRRERQKVNEHVRSPQVADNLGRELEGLRIAVEETFAGDASEVRQKQKTNAKALQYEGYKGKRGIQ